MKSTPTLRDLLFTLCLCLALPACQPGAGEHADSLAQPATCAASSAAPEGACIGSAHVDGDACSMGDAAPPCSGEACDYDAEVAALRAEGCGERLGGGRAMVQLGVCGAYRVIDLQGWGIGDERIQFYDAAGKLLAAQQHSDTTEFCGGTSFAVNDGPVPDCHVTTCETICQAAGYTCLH